MSWNQSILLCHWLIKFYPIVQTVCEKRWHAFCTNVCQNLSPTVCQSLMLLACKPRTSNPWLEGMWSRFNTSFQKHQLTIAASFLAPEVSWQVSGSLASHLCYMHLDDALSNTPQIILPSTRRILTSPKLPSFVTNWNACPWLWFVLVGPCCQSCNLPWSWLSESGFTFPDGQVPQGFVKCTLPPLH